MAQCTFDELLQAARTEIAARLGSKPHVVAASVGKAVEKTFPASDPVTVGKPTGTEPAKRPVDRKPPVITKEQVEAAERGEGHAHRDAASPAEDQEARHQKDGHRASDYMQRELDEPVKKVVDDKLRDPFIATKKGEKEAEQELKKGVELRQRIISTSKITMGIFVVSRKQSWPDCGAPKSDLPIDPMGGR